MIKEFIVSFFDNVKTKTTNPFLGTLILVWIFENWKLLFTFFGLPDNLTLDEKIEKLNLWLNPISFSVNLMKCIGLSIFVLILTYSLLNLSRLILNIFEYRVTPLIYKFFGPGKIVTKDLFESVIRERDSLINNLEKEREARAKLQSEVSSLEDIKVKYSNEVVQSKDKDKRIDDLAKTVDDLRAKSIESEKYEKLQQQLNKITLEYEKMLEENSRRNVLIHKSGSINEMEEFFNNLETINKFKSLINSINNGKSIDREVLTDDDITKYTANGLIERSNKTVPRVSLTQRGNDYMKYFISNGLNVPHKARMSTKVTKSQ